MKLKKNNNAPSFELFDQNGLKHQLPVKGQWTLVYFYPKDDTPGCTKEACSVQELTPEYDKYGLKVFGVSPDTVTTHGKFAKKYGLTFPLLADESKEVVRVYGAWGRRKFMGREYMGVNRISYLIDPKGKIAKTYLKVKPEEHAAEVLKDLEEFRSSDH